MPLSCCRSRAVHVNHEFEKCSHIINENDSIKEANGDESKRWNYAVCECTLYNTLFFIKMQYAEYLIEYVLGAIQRQMKN